MSHTIAAHGDPLTFLVREGEGRSSPLLPDRGHEVFKVEDAIEKLRKEVVTSAGLQALRVSTVPACWSR